METSVMKLWILSDNRCTIPHLCHPLIFFVMYVISIMNQQQERWVSGLNHRFAKPAKEVIPSEGSNPSLSAKTVIFLKNTLNSQVTTTILLKMHQNH